MRKALEENVALPPYVIVRLVDRVIESFEFSLGVWRMKAACMAAGVEGGKQVMREQVAIRKFNHGEPSAVVELNLSNECFHERLHGNKLCFVSSPG